MRKSLLLLLLCLTVPAFTQTNPGEAVYKKSCAMCHDNGVSRAPNLAVMASMSYDNVKFALTSGKMQIQGVTLSRADLAAVASFVSGKEHVEDRFPAEAYCKAAPQWSLSGAGSGPQWNGWGGSPLNHRFQPTPGIAAAEVPQLKLKWAFGFPGDSRATAQPAIAGGRLFTGSQGRRVYSLDAKTGCIYWAFDAEFPVRTAITVTAKAIYFSDQHASAYAVDPATGKPLWKTRVETHPAAIGTGAPTLAEGKVLVPISSGEEVFGAAPNYECCTFRGSVSALDAVTGKVLWKAYTIAETPHPVRKNKIGTQLYGPAGAGIWSAPTVDLKKRAVYVTTGDNYQDPPTRTSDAFLAFSLDTGKLLWSRQLTANDAYTGDCRTPNQANCPEANGPDVDFGSSPILIELGNGKRALVAGQKSGVLQALDPDQQGEVLWQVRLGKGGVFGGLQWGQAFDGKLVFAALSDVGFQGVAPGHQGGRMLGGAAVDYDPKAGGGLFALDPKTGSRVWTTPHPGCGERARCSPAQSAAVTAIPGAVFSGGLDGVLRAYSTADGKIIWEYDTIREFQTANGVKANGGTIDGAGAVVAGGMVYATSGYAVFGGRAGNVLLAFGVE